MGSAKFVKSATKPDDFPRDRKPEIVFCGRSNIGKSSLINTLVDQEGLARTSSSPGRTQTINFYAVDDRMYFVDIPGYGYAKVSKSIKDGWRRMIESYLIGREALRLAVILVDARIAPMDSDLQMKSWLDYYEVPNLIVLTKADKLSRNQLTQSVKNAAQAFRIGGGEVVPFSAVTRLGKDHVWKKIRAAIQN